MFLRSTNRKKDGKDHRYFSIVENRRVSTGKTAQRTVLYLGEINDQQQASWRKSLSVFDEDTQRFTTLSLFPDDRPVPADAVDSVQVRVSGLELRRPRVFGNCWLGCEVWRQLGLEEFWCERLPAGREAIEWEKVLRLLVINRLVAPGSEFRLHREWFVSSAMDELLGTDFVVAEKDRLYRCLDRVLAHKPALFVWLKQQWADLFQADFDVLLYDLTSTYFEGEMPQNPKARRGYSRDHRPDCLQVVIALVITTDGFPLAYEVLNGNTSDRTTLRPFLTHIEQTYGQARRVWVMDRGIPSEAILAEMRDPDQQTCYLVGTPKGKIQQHAKQWLDLPWQTVRDSVAVKLYAKDGEVYVLARSTGRQQKEVAIRRKRLARLLRKLRAMRRSLPSRDHVLLRLGAAKKEAGRAFGFVKIRVPDPGQAVTRETFHVQVDTAKLRAAELRDGHYLLRSNLTADDPAVLWTRYVQLTRIEAAFRSLKSELGIRPIYHHLEHRVDAHIFIAFLAYCLQVTLRSRLRRYAPGLTPAAVLDLFASIQMIDVWIPTCDGRWLILPRYTQPDRDLQLLLHQLQLTLPSQPPPRIRAAPAVAAQASLW
ncbi:MAG: IS1634 family transposase [Acidobacteria bacterium]|nr:IS1634 family transposase [Acidobacteriota bacterium]